MSSDFDDSALTVVRLAMRAPRSCQPDLFQIFFFLLSASDSCCRYGFRVKRWLAIVSVGTASTAMLARETAIRAKTVWPAGPLSTSVPESIRQVCPMSGILRKLITPPAAGTPHASET